MRYVVDAPTLLHLVTAGVEVAAEHQLVGPQVVRSQALGLLYAETRAGRLDEREARRLHTLMTETKMRLLGDRVSRWTAYQIATELDLPDTAAAEYLAVCRLQADAFVSVDPDAAALAARAVPVADVDDLTR